MDVRCYQGLDDLIKPEIIKYLEYRGAGSHCLGWDTPSPNGSSASENYH